jgi:alkyl hydroperoxide reductase subunit AhpC
MLANPLPSARRFSLFTQPEGELKMSLINTEIKPFKATAFHNGKFGPVSDADLTSGRWSSSTRSFTFVCPTELGPGDEYASFQKL